MPGRKSYGPGGKWIHDRANKMLDSRRSDSLTERYGEEKGKRIAYAIATQQAHKVGKSPKKHRTAMGVRMAKAKYNKPAKEYRKTAMLAGLFDELEQIEKEAGWLKNTIIGAGMLGAVGGGMKAAAPAAKAAVSKARPAITQTVKRTAKSAPRIGRGQLKNPEVARALNF